MEKIDAKEALRMAFSEATLETTADQIVERAKELINETCIDELRSVAHALHYEPLYAAVKKLSQDRYFFANTKTLKFINSLIIEMIGFNPRKACDII